MRDLSRKFRAACTGSPSMPSRLAHFGQRHLQLLVGAEESLHTADARGNCSTAAPQLRQVEHVVHAPVLHDHITCRGAACSIQSC